MNIRPASIAVTIMFGVLLTPVAFAQTIAFNRNITCGNERMAIESCFDDSDNAGCMVIYPDRPLRNGFTVQEVEKRGDVIKKIKGCMGANATLASTGHPAPSAAPASAPASATARPSAAAPKPNVPPPPPDPSVAKAHAAGVDTTALGLHLGEAFTLPQCPDGFAALGALLGGPSAPKPVYPCVTSPTNQNGVISWGVDFSQADCPAWLPNPCIGTLLVQNGLIQGLYIYTTGQAGDAQASAQLRAKYGKPTQQQAVTFKNLYNYTAQFQQLNWTLPGFYVEYDPTLTDINQGEVKIETETGHQISAAVKQTQNASQPRF